MLVVRPRDAGLQSSPFKPSMFNVSVATADGYLQAINTLTGSSISVDPTKVAAFEEALSSERISSDQIAKLDLGDLIRAGFFVLADREEEKVARFVKSEVTSRSDYYHLIILPTEQCNFRCVYCYEDFTHGVMRPEIRDALRQHVSSVVGNLRTLAIDWFGGEPMLAFDEVISELAPEFYRLAHAAKCAFKSHITTNGYLLSKDRAQQLLSWGVNSFQITIDGGEDEHNKRRKLHKQSGGTFKTIIDNVASLLSIRELFIVTIRINYDRDSLPSIPAFLYDLKRWLGADPRVRVDFCPIWGEPGITPVSVPMGKERQRSMVDLFEVASTLGFRTGANEWFVPGGMVCYAARPNSFVVRSDGRLNKCTVALNSEYNQVGKFGPNGRADLDLHLMAKWTSSGLEADPTCAKCSLSPSCQGNTCPLERFENSRRPCPAPKAYAQKLLPIAVRALSDRSQ